MLKIYVYDLEFNNISRRKIPEADLYGQLLIIKVYWKY